MKVGEVMGEIEVEIYGCNKCESLTMVEQNKEVKCCAVCGEVWDSENLYVGGSGTVTNIVENG